MTKQYSVEALEWDQCQPISEQLPYTFANGLAFNGCDAECGNCGAPIFSQYMRGTLAELSNQQCVMLAKGYCEGCNTLTCFEFLIDGGDEPKIIDLAQHKEGLKEAN